MLNIYLNSFYWKEPKFTKLRFPSISNLSPGIFLATSKTRRYISFNFKTSCYHLKGLEGRASVALL